MRPAIKRLRASFHGRGEAAVRVPARAVSDEDTLASHGDTLLLLSRDGPRVKACSRLMFSNIHPDRIALAPSSSADDNRERPEVSA